MSISGSMVTSHRNFVLGSVFLIAMVVVGIWAAFAFVDNQKQQDIKSVNSRLRVIGDSRAAAISGWVDQHMEIIRQLSENESLQIYLTNIVLAGAEGEDIDLEHPEAEYLSNFLKNQAVVSNFWSGEPPTVTANVTYGGQSGLALLNVDGHVLVSSNALPEMSTEIRQAMVVAAQGRPAFVNLFDSGSGQATVGFIQPVVAVQADEELVGFVVGLKVLDDDFFNLLNQPGELSKTAEAILAENRDGLIVYLSPLKDGTKPLKKIVEPSDELAAAFAISNPSGFALKRDYRGEQVFVASERIRQFGWTLIQKIDAADALSVSNERGQTMLVIFLLILSGMVVVVIAVWRHGTSVKAAQAANQFRELAAKMERANRFMKVVTDSQPTSIAVLDESDRFVFANRVASQRAGAAAEDMIGKTMEAVIGAARANNWNPLNREARLTKEAVMAVKKFTVEGKEYVVQSEHIPLGEDENDSILLIQQDITDLRVERQKSEKAMRDLVGTLVSLVDQLDPHSANHSARVTEVAVTMAAEMGLEDDQVKTIDIVSNIMNLGKIFVPSTILLKTGKLDAEEQKTVQESLEKGTSLLDKVDFSLPVSETLHQLYENYDGSGYPNGLTGAEISLLAQTVAVANAFVSMVSARSYRDAMPIDKAVGFLFEDIEVKFDRRPVSALLNCLDNKGAREKWAHFGDGGK